MIHLVPIHAVPDVWPALDEYAKRAAEYHPFLDPEDMLSILMSGMGALFVSTDEQGIEGFVICEVIRFPKVVAGNVVAAGGRHGFLDTLKEGLLLSMEQWAASQGATVFTINGRRGWLRPTKQAGFEATLAVQAWRRIDGRRERRRPDS